MESSSIARNYADALLTLATRDDGRDSYGAYINGLADVLERDATFQRFLAAPQVPESTKNEVLGKALTGQAPSLFVRFIQKMVTNRRQMLLGEVATEYNNLRDTQEGRVQARVTVSRELSEADRESLMLRIASALARESGQVLVTGHTDSSPIRTARFPSNWHLSEERAQTVRRLLIGGGVQADRVRAEGRADGEPLAANDTPANKALNRRVEITLMVSRSGQGAIRSATTAEPTVPARGASGGRP